MRRHGLQGLPGLFGREVDGVHPWSRRRSLRVAAAVAGLVVLVLLVVALV
ncbi:hypothetical protein ACFRFL_24935 [Streptomyces sp. NPDC056708]